MASVNMSTRVRLKTSNGGPQTDHAQRQTHYAGGGGIPKLRFKGINPWTVFKTLEVILVSLLHFLIN